MTDRPQSPECRQRGIVLVSSLLLLVVVTIMALSIFRSFGVQERIAGNTREKQRALQAAISTQQYAETWLMNSSSAGAAISAGLAQSADVPCTAAGTLATPTICSNTLQSLGVRPTQVPWTGTGVSYLPTGMNYAQGAVNTNVISNAAIVDIYYDQPRFYITDLGPLASSNGEVYKIDSYSYGVGPSTVAVVESTFAITCIVCNPGAL